MLTGLSQLKTPGPEEDLLDASSGFVSASYDPWLARLMFRSCYALTRPNRVIA